MGEAMMNWEVGKDVGVPDGLLCPHCLKPIIEGQEVEYERGTFSAFLHLECFHYWNESILIEIEAERKAEAAWSQIAL